jgi:flagellar motor switch/type III secretory pathway protein FliN
VNRRPGRVGTFSFEGLPRLPRASLAGTRALARARAHLPVELTASLRRLGTVAVRVARVSFVAPAEGEGTALALELRGAPARLLVEPLLALRLVASVLGAPAPLLVRPLGRAERGVLAALIATFLEAAGADGSVRVALAGPAAADGPDTLALELRVRTGEHVGTAWLDLPARALPAGGARLLDVDPRRLAPLVTVELARTTLPLAAFSAAAAGDAVVFDGVAPASAERPWTVELRSGALACVATLEPDGSLRRRGPVTHHPESETKMSSEAITAPVPAPAALSEEASRALAAATVEIVAEVGRLAVRGDELVGLIEGGVLPLGPRRPAAVVLRVSGRVWAHGELVAVDDELAVRITELVK